MKLLFALLACFGVCRAESMAGYFIAAGVPLVATGLSCVVVGASMQPAIDYQADYLRELDEALYPVAVRNHEREYLEALKSKQGSLKTLGYIFVGAGVGSLIIAKLEFDRARKVLLSPVITKDSAGLRMSIRL